MANGLQMRQRVAATVHASVVLGARTQLAVDRAQTLKSAALALRAAAEAARTNSRAALASLPPRTPVLRRDLVGFTVEGLVDGQRVGACWRNGRLECDESLRDRALFLVDLREELTYTDPPRRFEATLDGRPVAVALTLLRACDRVLAFEFDLP